MSNIHIKAAYLAQGLTTAQKSILVSLADRANHAGYCYPSLNDLANRSSCTTRTVTSSIKALEKLGFLVAIRDDGSVNKYVLTLGDLPTTIENQDKEKLSTPSKLTAEPLKQTAQNMHEFLGTLETISNKPSINHQLTPNKPKHTENQKLDGEITAAGVCVLWREFGLLFSNPLNPDLIALVESNTPLREFEFAAKMAIDRGKGFGYALGVVKSRMADKQRNSLDSARGVGNENGTYHRTGSSRLEHSRRIGAHLDRLFEQEFGPQMGSCIV